MKNLLLACLLLATQSLFAQLNLPNDCIDAIPLCSETTYSDPNPVFDGEDCDITEQNKACVVSPGADGCDNEYSPTFLYVEIKTAGRLEFLAGSRTSYDIDYMLFGPCTGSSMEDYCDYLRNNQPIRCNSCAGGIGTSTGIRANGLPGVCPTQDPNLAVNAGEVYIIVIQQNAWPPNAVGFDLWFNGGTGNNQANSTCTFNCGILPVEFAGFAGWSGYAGVNLEWNTAMEKNLDHFDIHRWDDSFNVEVIGSVDANGGPSSYRFFDEHAPQGNLYYQIVTYDEDGTRNMSEVINVFQAFDRGNAQVTKAWDLWGRELDPANLPKGELVILQYSNGEVGKLIITE